jgi:hypothetical protein
MFELAFALRCPLHSVSGVVHRFFDATWDCCSLKNKKYRFHQQFAGALPCLETKRLMAS